MREDVCVMRSSNNQRREKGRNGGEEGRDYETADECCSALESR